MKRYVKFTQPIFAGTRYDKQAAKILVDSGLYNEDQATRIIDALFHEDIHAFVHAPNWLEKYLKGIARMCVEEGHGSQQGVSRFLEDSVNNFDKFLNYVKENRDKLGGAAFDTKFNDTMHYSDVVSILTDIQEELDRQSEAELAKMQDARAASNYKLVPISTFDQFNSMFGGHWTGDGSSDKYAGGGGTAWCHANSRSVYDSWRRRGKFYVLARKDFKDIPFNAESNRQDPKDEYGNSLIAMLVNPTTGTLENATLRCNHVGVSMSADNQYKTYAELSQIAGFNVKDAVLEDLGDSIGEIKTRAATYDKSQFAVGDQFTVEDGVHDTYTLTAVKRGPGSALFIPNVSLGESVMDNVGDVLDSIDEMLPGELRDRLDGLRLLQASEIFSDCDEPDEWDYLENCQVDMENPQIPYFRMKAHRVADNDTQWWTSTPSEGGNHYVVVDRDGECNCLRGSRPRGVRPAFIFLDLA